MDRYICLDCNKTFRAYGIHVDTESVLVRKLREYCPHCGSFNLDLTEHGKLLIERQKKIQRLNEIGGK